MQFANGIHFYKKLRDQVDDIIEQQFLRKWYPRRRFQL